MLIAFKSYKAIILEEKSKTLNFYPTNSGVKLFNLFKFTQSK